MWSDDVSSVGVLIHETLAFTTTVGAGGTSLIGTSGVDTVALNAGTVSAPIYIGAQGDDDIVNFVTTAVNTANVELGAGDDIFSQSAASVIGTSQIRGNDGSDTLNIAADINTSTINGNQGSDTINVSAGVTVDGSTIHGGQGSDTLTFDGVTLTGSAVNGNIGNDVISVTLNAAMERSGSDAATIYGGQGNDTITLNNGVDGTDFAAFAGIVSGDSGDDVLTGALGDDTIYGGEGADVIDGGVGSDYMVGGDGVDIFKPDSSHYTATAPTTVTSITVATGIGFVSAANTATSTAGTAVLPTATTATIAGGYFTAQIDQGFDVISDFTPGLGGDKIDLTIANRLTLVNPAAAFDATGVANIAISGTYSSSSGRFTVAASTSSGPDTLVVAYDPNAGLNGTEGVVLKGVNATQLVASNIV